MGRGRDVLRLYPRDFANRLDTIQIEDADAGSGAVVEAAGAPYFGVCPNYCKMYSDFDVRVKTQAERLRVEICASRIDGKGAFAVSDFRRGELVGEFSGEVISTTEGLSRARGLRRIAIIELDEALAIDASKSKGPFRYLNHSCEPNTFMRRGDGWIRFYARRGIRGGEELTSDYGESHHEGKLVCRCGSLKCRGFL